MHKFILSLLLLASFGVQAQKQLVWPVLGLTTYDIHEEGIQTSYHPKFPNILVDQFEGKEVIIAGYLIPMDVEAQRYALSENPFSSCFFCGNAGPETVMELRFDEDPGRFATDKYVSVKGTLRLVRDGSGLFFILENAEIHA